MKEFQSESVSHRTFGVKGVFEAVIDFEVVLDERFGLIARDYTMVAFVREVAEHEDWHSLRRFRRLFAHVVKGPRLRHVEHEDDGVTTFIDVDEFGVERRLRIAVVVEFKALKFNPLFRFVHNVPNFDFHDVLGIVMAEIDIVGRQSVGHCEASIYLPVVNIGDGNFFAGGEIFGLLKGFPLKAIEKSRLSRLTIAANH